MKYLYCIYDNFLDEFLPPFVAKNSKMAILSYETYLKENPLLKGQETKLFQCGEFDETKGVAFSGEGQKLLKEYNCEVAENG